MYLSASQLASGPEMAHELSELFGVETGLLIAVLNGEPIDPADWSASEQAAAVNALDVIDEVIVRASSEIDARLARRGYALPVDVTRFPIVGTWARSIARYWLHPQREGTQETTGRIERDYRDAIRALDLVAEGKLLLGAADPLLVTGGVHVKSPGRHFSRQSLGAL